MAFRLTSKPQVSGYRFLLSRSEHAIVRRDTAMHDDPMRLQSNAMVIGTALSVLAVLGALVLGFFSPAGTITDETKIVRDRDTGALYVRVGSTFNPVMNLASARLIAGSAGVQDVKGQEIDKMPRGPLVGIPGAPDRLTAGTPSLSQWSVCDTVATDRSLPRDTLTGVVMKGGSPLTTTVVGGPLTVGDKTSAMGGSQALLTWNNGQTWLLWHGHRSLIDLSNAAVTLPLGITASTPVVPISQGLFNAIPQAPEIAAPQIASVGKAPSYKAPEAGLTIGSTFEVRQSSNNSDYYVLLENGIERIPLTVATMIRTANPSAAVPPVVSLNALVGITEVTSLPVGHLPDTTPVFLGPVASPVTCFTWERDGNSTPAVTSIIVGQQLPLTPAQRSSLVSLPTGGQGEGATANNVSMPAGAGRLVTVTGADPSSPRTEYLYWIADTGVRYGIPVDTASDKPLDSLGVGLPQVAPWFVVRLFAEGPALSKADAMTEHDRIGPDMRSQPVPATPAN